MFTFDRVQVVVDRASLLYVDDPITIDYEPGEGAYRLRVPTHVIPDRFRL